MEVRLAILPALLLAACGSAASRPSLIPPPSDPLIEFTESDGGGWSAAPVQDSLDSVSNNGLGYTGEIHIYELTPPATGRLQVSLSWDHASDFDLIVAEDRQGKTRLAEGLLTSNEPEYVRVEVVEGKTIYLLVAGWEGAPGDYKLETILVPPGVEPFAFDGVDPGPVARNLPIRFRFNQDLDLDQVVSERVLFLTQGHVAEGTWCIHGAELVFYPRLPEWPGDTGGVREGERYIFQVAPAARGLRALNGEYLTELVSAEVDVGGLVDEDPHDQPHVTDLDHPVAEPWGGQTLTITVVGLLDPHTVAVYLHRLDESGVEAESLPLRFILRQQYACFGDLLVRLELEPIDPLPSAARVRLRVPGTVRGISGRERPSNMMREYSVDLSTP